MISEMTNELEALGDRKSGLSKWIFKNLVFRLKNSKNLQKVRILGFWFLET